MDELALRIVDGRDHPIYLTCNGGGMDRSHRADRVEIDTNVALLRRGSGNACRSTRTSPGSRLRGIVVMAQYKEEPNGKN